MEKLWIVKLKKLDREGESDGGTNGSVSVSLFNGTSTFVGHLLPKLFS